MKKIILGLVLVVSMSAVAQELVKTTQFKIPKKSESFQIVEEDTKNVTFFFSNKKTINSIRFDNNFEIIDSLSISKNDKNLEDIVGYSIVDNKYYTFWTTSEKNEFISQCFDYNNKVVSSQKHFIEFENEITIKKITIKNIFYIVTAVKNSNILNFHIFNGNKYSKKTTDLSESVFYDFMDRKSTLYDLFNMVSGIDNSASLQTISNDSPPSLTFASSKKKCYNYNDNFIITLDVNKKITQYISINLTNFTYESTRLNQPEITENYDYIRDSNSFVVENGIIQINLNSSNMALTFKSFDNKLLKSYKAYSDKEITFKNSEIYQENKSVKNTRILDKSNQLLRKIYNSHPSISSYSSNGVNYITIGSVSDAENNDAIMIGAMLGGLSGALIGAVLTTNYSVNNLNSYSNRKVVYINSMFDTNFNHIQGDAKKLAFDKLRVFAEDNKQLTYKTIFKLNSNLYFAGLNKKTNNYSFYKFVD